MASGGKAPAENGRIRFFGAVRNVTGSKHLLEWRGRRILLDCGLVQGRRAEAEKANRRLPFDPRRIDHVILSHAHIDHSGTLPILVREGFKGRIWCTEATRDLATVLLRDSGAIHEQDAFWWNEKRRRRGEPPAEPLYTIADAERASKRLHGIPYRTPAKLDEDLELVFLDAGHIPGSAQVHLSLGGAGDRIRLGFTGDFGRKDMPVLRDPDRMPPVDVLLTESTYGGRRHKPRPDLETDLAAIIEEEQRDGGRILIPSFAVGRTQNLLYVLGRLLDSGGIDRLPVVVDSPLAREATLVLERHPEIFDEVAAAEIASGRSLFSGRGIRFTHSVEESKALNRTREPCIILSASGMCENGRIRHHLLQSLERPEDCVLLVGWMAPHTLGRRLLEGRPRVRLLGEERTVRCRIRKMNGLSAHADEKELVEGLRHLARGTRKVWVLHGEPGPSESLASALRKAGFGDVQVPIEGKSYPFP